MKAAFEPATQLIFNMSPPLCSLYSMLNSPTTCTQERKIHERARENLSLLWESATFLEVTNNDLKETEQWRRVFSLVKFLQMIRPVFASLSPSLYFWSASISSRSRFWAFFVRWRRGEAWSFGISDRWLALILNRFFFPMPFSVFNEELNYSGSSWRQASHGRGGALHAVDDQVVIITIDRLCLTWGESLYRKRLVFLALHSPV